MQGSRDFQILERHVPCGAARSLRRQGPNGPAEDAK